MLRMPRWKKGFALGFSAIILLVPLIGAKTIQAASDIENRDGKSPCSVTRDYWPTDGWRNSTPAEQGMDGSRLNALKTFVSEESRGIDGIIVVRHGYIVLEEYPDPYFDEYTHHSIFSCTKSVISALVGIALEEGLLTSVDQKVLSFFPNRTFNNTDSHKENLTLEHLLTMTSGLEWYELDVPRGVVNDYAGMHLSDDWVEYVLNRSIIEPPGEVWNYNSGTSHILSVILQQVTNTTSEEYMEWINSHLADSIGLDEIKWYSDPQGFLFGGSGMMLTPRDMAKFGYLYLNNGIWDGNQIVPESWVNVSTSSLVEVTDSSKYGYQWWIRPNSCFYAAQGHAGQMIMVMPDYDIVIAVTAYNTEDWPYSQIVGYYIIPAANYNPVTTSTSTTTSLPDLLPATIIIAAVIVLVLVVGIKIRRG